MQLTVWVIPPLIGVLLCVASAVQARRSYPRAAGRALQWMLTWVALWCGAQAASLAFAGQTAQVWFSKLQYPGVLGASVCWLLFALYRTRRRLPGGLGRALIVVPVVITLLVLTNERHGLIWSQVEQVSAGGMNALSLTHGPFFYLHALFCYSLAVGASALLTLQPRGRRLTNRQWFAIICAPSLVVVATIFYLSPQGLGVWLDFVPVSYALAGALLGRALLDRRDSELAPIAHSVIFESLRDAVFVIDAQERIVDMNHAAASLVGGREVATGRRLPDLLSASLLQTALDLGIHEIEDVTLRVAPDRLFSVTVSPIHVQQSHELNGRVLVFRDTTDRSRIESGLRMVTDSLEEANLELERLAHTDTLTELANRRHFFLELEKEVQRGLRHGNGFCLMMLDLDHFKRVNDRHGHVVGDEVLVAVARSLRSVVREVDFVARMGGEEFAVLMPETELEGAIALAERLRVRVGTLPHIGDNGESFHVTVSVGVAAWAVGRDPNQLLRVADAALYTAKNAGRNRVVSGDGVGSGLN